MEKKKITVKITPKEKALLDFLKRWDKGDLYTYIDEVLQLAVYHTNPILFNDKQQISCSALHELKNHILNIERSIK